MGLKDVLEKMKLVETGDDDAAVSSPSPAPPPMARRPTPPPAPRASASIGDIVQKTPPPALDETALPKGSAETIPDFPAIYQASGVKDPAHGFTAYKVLEILSSAAAVIAEGEVMQLGAAKNTATTEDDYLAVIRAKTAR